MIAPVYFDSIQAKGQKQCLLAKQIRISACVKVQHQLTWTGDSPQIESLKQEQSCVCGWAHFEVTGVTSCTAHIQQQICFHGIEECWGGGGTHICNAKVFGSMVLVPIYHIWNLQSLASILDGSVVFNCSHESLEGGPNLSENPRFRARFLSPLRTVRTPGSSIQCWSHFSWNKWTKSHLLD